MKISNILICKVCIIIHFHVNLVIDHASHVCEYNLYEGDDWETIKHEQDTSLLSISAHDLCVIHSA